MGLDLNLTIFMLIAMRLSGCILFNPIFGRKNIPVIFKVGLVLFITYFVYNAYPIQNMVVNTSLELIIIMMKELLLGFIFGYIIQLFMSVFILAGEIIDLQLGISMAKVYDPQSNVSMAVTASFLNIMFILIFFAVNGHLTIIQIFCFSFKAIPLGLTAFDPNIFKELAAMLSYILVYAVKMAMPILAAEIITEIGVGIIMKAVPQINVFVVNLQLKIILGLAVLLILVGPYASFLERLILLMFDKMNLVFNMFS